MSKERFEFGLNWTKYINAITNKEIREAEKHLKEWFPKEYNFKEKYFLDVGSGSGLFSLAARRLGAKVYSFDYDLNSVECTRKLKDKYFKNDNDWIIEQGDILNKDYVESIIKSTKFGEKSTERKFDIVYSWGVLHHTGNMKRALDNVDLFVNKEDGKEAFLFISIYNDQGSKSIKWRRIKKIYNKSSKYLKMLLIVLVAIYCRGFRGAAKVFYSHFFVKKNVLRSRGMDAYTDLIDWVGGYPFEVSSPEKIFKIYKDKGYELEKFLTVGGGLGCNQYLLKWKSTIS